MLPVATPPNAIVFSSGRISIMQMASAGLWLKLYGALVIVAASGWLAGRALG
jgi:sodium-dependent dicarboxylate transporter 2/3/5